MTDAPPPPPAGWEPPPDPYGAYPPPPPPDLRPYAAWWRRLVAALLDGLIVGVPLGILGAALGWVEIVKDVEGNFVRYSASTGMTGLSFLVTLAYSALMDGSQRGATVGKMALQIQVRDADVGGPIGPARALVRRFVYLALFYALVIPGLVNALSPLWDSRNQAWHDKAVKSVVVNSV